MVDIASTLGIGSGIDTASLVSQLTAATYDPKANAVNTRVTTNSARVSGVASAKSALDTFSNALTELLKSADYNGTPVSNDTSIAAVGLLTGGVPTGLPAQLEVRALANAQVLQGPALSASTAVAGTGDLTLTVGSTSTTITLTSPHNTLQDLATAINSAKAGVSASIVTDQSGARLVLKGATGAANAFTLSAGATADADLQRFTWDGTTGGMARQQQASNSKITIDGVDMEFASNQVTTAIPYVRIDLNRAAPGTTVTLATDQPTSSMADLVGEFVSAYNNLKTALNTSMNGSSDGKTVGLLSSDGGLREMSRRLASLVSTQLTDTGDYRTLGDLGVQTQRDGTLTLNSTVLNAALAKNPQAVTQMLNPTVPSTTNPGIAGALKGVTDYLNATDGPLASSKAIYDNLAKSLQTQLDKIGTDRTDYSDRLTKTYSAMQTQLLKIKSTQSYLDQQIAQWNSSKN
ncbi:flagellar filament capping protein FliD [Sphingobium nicotianae]|uniref:Flagellar hook-associated protein 2 n=1 Tax=Sphingobium nicotianae TaxID=2782607 RepID=A0A9X1DAN9_9SPHN|nr:flagellar filament capping protein FliD [Sphingobium nicotianae]MBT2186474.1 flagellar filament capping protein FliD [Sphingobium nicotianae]